MAGARIAKRMRKTWVASALLLVLVAPGCVEFGGTGDGGVPDRIPLSAGLKVLTDPPNKVHTAPPPDYFVALGATVDVELSIAPEPVKLLLATSSYLVKPEGEVENWESYGWKWTPALGPMPETTRIHYWDLKRYFPRYMGAPARYGPQKYMLNTGVIDCEFPTTENPCFVMTPGQEGNDRFVFAVAPGLGSSAEPGAGGEGVFKGMRRATSQP